MLLANILLANAQVTFTTYHDKNGKETKDANKAHFIRQLTPNQGDNPTVVVKETYTSGNKTKLYGTYKSIMKKVFIGPKLQAYETGKLRSKETFSLDGKLIDTAYYYYPNGKLKIAYEYPFITENEQTKIKDTLILVFNDSLGNRLLFNGEGYAEIGAEQGNFKNHKREGIWKGKFSGGKYSFTEEYKQGKLIKGESQDSIGNIYTYDATNFEVQPEYPDGMQALRAYIAANYVYPKEAITNRVNGTVKVSFVINKNGEMTDLKVDEDLGYGTGEAALQILRKARKWSPGLQRGIPVRVAYNLPIRLNTR